MSHILTQTSAAIVPGKIEPGVFACQIEVTGFRIAATRRPE
jgi:hypothetical protein